MGKNRGFRWLPTPCPSPDWVPGSLSVLEARWFPFLFVLRAPSWQSGENNQRHSYLNDYSDGATLTGRAGN